MLLHLKLWPLEVYFVLGRVYRPAYDDVQRTCLRMAWRGQPMLRFGARSGV